MLSADDLAKEMFSALDAKDKDGNAVTSTDGMKAFAKGFIAMLTQGKMVGMFTGFGMPNGAPMPPSPSFGFVGQSAKGNFVALVPMVMATQVVAGIPTGNPALMNQEAAAIATYFMTTANIIFGEAYGVCTAVAGSPPVPGVLVGGYAKGGKVVGITGAVMAAQVAAQMGVPITPDMIKMYNALCSYVMKNIELSYLPNQINGAFPLPGPVPIPLTGGVGSGGLIQ